MNNTDNQAPVSESVASETSSLFNTAINIFVSPDEALSTLKLKPKVLFPLLLTVITTVIVYAWYFQFVDYAWYVDDMIARIGANMPAERQEVIREAMSQQSRNGTTITSSLGGAFSIVMIYVLQAGYLTLVSALSGDRFRFRHWFSLITWTGLPYLLVVLVMGVNILLSPNGQLSLYEANSLSLASLGFSATGNTMLQTMLETMNLPMFWSIGLTVYGYYRWTQCHVLRAVVAVLAPYMVIFGTLAYFTLT